MNKVLFSIVLIAILAVGAGAIYFYSRTITYPSIDGVACTMEAKQCPDGSYVGRTGPKCEFSACPSERVTPAPNSSDSGIRGTVVVGPTCPVESIPPDPGCADKLYATTLVLTTADQSRVLREFHSDANGKFSISIPPGEYAIRSAAATNILPYCASNDTIKVSAHTYIETVISCDSGIR